MPVTTSSAHGSEKRLGDHNETMYGRYRIIKQKLRLSGQERSVAVENSVKKLWRRHYEEITQGDGLALMGRICETLTRRGYKKIALYGMGDYGRRVLTNHNFSPLDVVAVFDGDPAKAGVRVNGHIIMPPDELVRSDADIVLILSALHCAEMRETIQKIKPGQEIFSFDEPMDVGPDRSSINCEILFVQNSPCIRNLKMASVLARAGARVAIASITDPRRNIYGFNTDKLAGAHVVYDFKSLMERVENVGLIHSHNWPDTLTAVMKNTGVPIVHDFHDIISMRPFEDMDLFVESEAVRASSGFCFVSGNQWRHVREAHGEDAAGKPGVVIPNYPVKAAMRFEPLEKLSERTGDIHLVYCGGAIAVGKYRNFLDVFNRIAGRGVHIHAYPIVIHQEYRELERKNPYFHLHNPLPYFELPRELSQYDIGLFPFFEQEEEFKVHLDSALPNKIFEYHAAGLPVISSDHKEIARYFSKAGGGVVVDSAEGVRDSLEKAASLTVNRDATPTMDDHAEEIVQMYDKILNRK